MLNPQMQKIFLKLSLNRYNLMNPAFYAFMAFRKTNFVKFFLHYIANIT